VLAVTFVITVAAGWYIWKEMNRVKPAVIRERRLAKKYALVLLPLAFPIKLTSFRKLAGLAGPSVEAVYLSRPSNLDVSSEEDMMSPVKNNEPRMGAYGYGGYGGTASYSTDTIEAPIPRSHVAGGEEWAMGERRTQGYPPQPHQQHGYHESEKEDRNQYRQSPASTTQRQTAPLIQDVSNPTGARRTNHEAWKTSDASTVGMGSWGGVVKDGSDSQQPRQRRQQASWDGHSLATPRAGAYQAQQTQQYQSHRPDEYGVGGGLSAFGAPMGGGDTVTVTPRNVVGGVRQSREMPGHAAGRSMRATVEGYEEDDTDLSYRAGSPPSAADGGGGRRGYALRDPGSRQLSESSANSGYHRHAGRDASAGTFGNGQSLHSREYATSGTTDDRDGQFIPPPAMNRR
jgi:hypothetical protein